jgi:hypothetical protein
MAERKIYAIGEDALNIVVHRMSGGNDGGDGSGVSVRLAKLEASVEHIQSDIQDIRTDIRAMKGSAERDFRILFGAIIVVALGLAGLMAKGFKWF